MEVVLTATLFLMVGGYLRWGLPRLRRTSALLITLGLMTLCLVGAGVAFSQAQWREVAWVLVCTSVALGSMHAGWRWGGRFALKRAAVKTKWEAKKSNLQGTLNKSASHSVPQIDLPRAPAQPPSAPVLAGVPRQLGRYRIERLLGQGAFGAVYLAQDTKINRFVALKILPLDAMGDTDERAQTHARWVREAETGGRLQHPDIVSILDAGEDQGLAFLAMEWIKGETLQRYTTTGHLLPVALVLEVVARVALALEYAHRQGVIHRDIKPANVMVDLEHSQVKVMDFGIARALDSHRTRTGLVMGTPSFMSPEQMMGQRLDAVSDFYALGVMLFQLLTGDLPHKAQSMAQLMHQIVHDKAPLVRTLRPELPKELDEWVAVMLEKKPQKRWSNGTQWAQQLREVAASLPSTTWKEASQVAPGPNSETVFEATLKLERPT